MLRHLLVENYALIERLDITLSPGLNIITGETGAGKSILLGALGLLLGARADSAALKENAHNCVVEGSFAIGAYGLEEFFEENDLEWADESIIRRVITPAGKSRAYVNDMPVQLSVLKELGLRLIDIHSQHHSLKVADPQFRMQIVDAMADNGALVEDYRVRWEALRTAEAELAEVRRAVEANLRDKEYIEFQHNQLAALKLRSGELEELEAEQKLLDNVERIAEALGESSAALDEEENGVLARVKRAESAFAKLRDVYAPAGELSERLHSVMVELKDISAELGDQMGRVDNNPQRAAEVVDRLDAIYTLLRKHSLSTVDELIALQADYAAKLAVIVDSDERLAALESRVTQCTTQAQKAAAKLTASRQKAGVALAKGVVAMLARLGMEHSQFVCDIAPTGALQPTGADKIDFLFSSSPKFTPQPLEKVASGGEISRVMLCLKALVADRANMPTIVFDEIDTGISGRIADVTGQIIAELSAGRQVVNITHLPQVASKGDTHFRVWKDAKAGRTNISLLSAEERIEEVAKMLSGNEVTEAAMAQARELIEG
ncbi:MAG: DNA repair protein RecN [Rikenellaceae bacterium]|nr:DNA repair protein RecN [Rikenellaceae bacterium]